MMLSNVQLTSDAQIRMRIDTDGGTNCYDNSTNYNLCSNSL